MDNGINKLRSFGKFSLDPVKCVLWHDGKPVDLPLKQVELLAVLTENSGEVVTKAELLDRVWQDSFVEESNLSRHIYLLRKMFKEHGEEETLIKTVPRRGYLFTGEIQDLQNTEIIIERHSLTKAVVDLDAGDEFDEPEPASIKPRRRLAAVAGAGVLIIIAAVVIAWYVIPRRAVSVDKVNSIAVLPLRSFSDQEPNSELRIRLTDALITRLGELRKVVVRPTSAVLPFADSAESTIEIGKKLQVDAVVEARLQQEGERLRVTMQMIRTSDGANLWSGQFDGQTGKILDLQDSIADSVSRSLSGAVSDQPEFTKRSTENNDAYEAYLKGRYFWAKREPASLAKAADFFKQAAALDPQFSEAFSGLADTQHLLFSYNIDLRPELIEEAKKNVAHALELKPNSVDALVTLGTIQAGYDWNWAEAEATLARAVAEEPNSPTAQLRYGSLLVRLRRFDEAEAAIRRHMELDPLSVVGKNNLGMVRFCKKDYSAAETLFKDVLDLQSTDSTARWMLSRVHWLEGRKEEAIAEIGDAIANDGDDALAEKFRAKANDQGPEAAIRLLLHEWRTVPPTTNPFALANLSTYVNDTDGAIYWLDRSIKERHPWSLWIASVPEFEPLRGDKRFLAILQRMNLP